jgi:hypothetical protein
MQRPEDPDRPVNDDLPSQAAGPGMTPIGSGTYRPREVDLTRSANPAESQPTERVAQGIEADFSVGRLARFVIRIHGMSGRSIAVTSFVLAVLCGAFAALVTLLICKATPASATTTLTASLGVGLLIAVGGSIIGIYSSRSSHHAPPNSCHSHPWDDGGDGPSGRGWPGGTASGQ